MDPVSSSSSSIFNPQVNGNTESSRLKVNVPRTVFDRGVTAAARANIESDTEEEIYTFPQELMVSVAKRPRLADQVDLFEQLPFSLYYSPLRQLMPQNSTPEPSPALTPTLEDDAPPADEAPTPTPAPAPAVASSSSSVQKPSRKRAERSKPAKVVSDEAFPKKNTTLLIMLSHLFKQKIPDLSGYPMSVSIAELQAKAETGELVKVHEKTKDSVTFDIDVNFEEAIYRYANQNNSEGDTDNAQRVYWSKVAINAIKPIKYSKVKAFPNRVLITISLPEAFISHTNVKDPAVLVQIVGDLFSVTLRQFVLDPEVDVMNLVGRYKKSFDYSSESISALFTSNINDLLEFWDLETADLLYNWG